MNKTLLILVLLAGILSCENNHESPLILPAASEPSANLHNDSGISHFQARRYEDALLQFMQAYAADKTTGEIHFNIALAYHHWGDSKKAAEHFKLAEKYANGNDKILKSDIFNKYLAREN